MNQLLRYWGKKNSGDYHPLVYHSLDVAAVSKIILEEEKIFLRRFSEISSLDTEVIKVFIPFLISLHDIGKFSESFQNIEADLFKRLHNRPSKLRYLCRHDILGIFVWNKFLLNKLNLDTREDYFEPLVNAVMGHHGSPCEFNYCNQLQIEDLFSEQDKECSKIFAQRMRDIFGISNILENIYTETANSEKIRILSWLLAGLTVLSDWIGSNSDFFPFCIEKSSLENYWENRALPAARSAVEELGFKSPLYNKRTGTKILFPEFDSLTYMQEYVSNVAITDKPQLFILEDATGSGKTEAAFTLAHRIINKNNADAIYIGLPTMATSNAIYERAKGFYDRLLEKKENSSLVLAHSARKMYQGLWKLRADSKAAKHSEDEESAEAQCCAWLMDNKKKALLGTIAVGTIDQALMGVLPYRHQVLRLLGLSRSVLIVDEVHSYDPYTNKLLESLLQFHSCFGGSAILLSATLSSRQRKRFVDAFLKGTGKDINEIDCAKTSNFPLAIQVSDGEIIEKRINFTEEEKEIHIEFMYNKEKVYKKILQLSHENKSVCWIRNTVYDAIKTYKDLKGKVEEDKLLLFHSRYALGDRIEIENRVIELFGKESIPEKRGGYLLISTQVVEQSLDIDFDVMFSDLAPMDLLIQRAGRLQRHRSLKRDYPAKLYIFSPQITDSPNEDWYKKVFPKGKWVYREPGKMWLTAKILKEKSVIKMPKDTRFLIEGVYGNVDKEIPESLLNLDYREFGDKRAKESFASFNALKIKTGYTCTDFAWEDETYIPTRDGKRARVLRLLKWSNGKLTPWYQHDTLAWELSQVSVPVYYITDCALAEKDTELRIGIDKIKKEMPDHGKNVLLFPLIPASGNDELWQGLAYNDNDKKVEVSYTKKGGLVIG